MAVPAILSALFILGGIWILASALSRWGRAGTPQRRVAALALIGVGALIAGANLLSDRSTPLYIVAGTVAAIGALLLLTRGARSPERSLPRLKRRR